MLRLSCYSHASAVPLTMYLSVFMANYSSGGRGAWHSRLIATVCNSVEFACSPLLLLSAWVFFPQGTLVSSHRPGKNAQ